VSESFNSKLADVENRLDTTARHTSTLTEL